MAERKPRRLRAAALGALVCGALWLFGVWPPPVWWRTHWPRETAMMREETADGPRPSYRPTPLASISPLIQRMAIIGEDSRFRTHHGIDPDEMADALGLDRDAGFSRTVATIWRRRDQLRGASTITQQLAKNLYLSPSRNPLRKVKEIATAFRLELALSKDRILELYLDLAELGPGVWGMDGASRAYFGVPASAVTEDEAAALVATLPHPLTSNPVYRPSRTLARRDLILARFHGADVVVPHEEELDSIPLEPAIPVLPPPESLEIKMPAESTGDTLRDTLLDTARDTTRDTLRLERR